MKFHARHGLLVAFTTALYTLVLHFSGLLAAPFLGAILALAGLLIPILGLPWGIRIWRERFGHGYMTFGQGLKQGVLIVLWWALAAATFNVLYTTQLNAGAMEQAMAQQVAMMERFSLPPETMATMEKMMHFLLQPGVQFVLGVLSSAFWGTIISLVAAAILKRDPPLTSDTPPPLPGSGTA
jgi:hypothetical protein